MVGVVIDAIGGRTVLGIDSMGDLASANAVFGMTIMCLDAMGMTILGVDGVIIATEALVTTCMRVDDVDMAVGHFMICTAGVEHNMGADGALPIIDGGATEAGELERRRGTAV